MALVAFNMHKFGNSGLIIAFFPALLTISLVRIHVYSSYFIILLFFLMKRNSVC